jgi:hypothetical protein
MRQKALCFSETTVVFRICGSHSSDYEELCLPGYNNMQSLQLPFRRNTSPPSSASKNKPSKKQHDADTTQSYRLHGVISQETELLITVVLCTSSSWVKRKAWYAWLVLCTKISSWTTTWRHGCRKIQHVQISSQQPKTLHKEFGNRML